MNFFQSGGKLISFDDIDIFLSVGDYIGRHLAQEDDNVSGKLIKIILKDGRYKIIS